MKHSIEILIADDHPLFRKGLRQVIEAQPDMRIVYEAENGEEAEEFLSRYNPDVAILDIEMPKRAGLDVAHSVAERLAAPAIIIMTMHKDELLFNRAMDAGVKGYILKENAVTDVLQGIRMVAEGSYYISPFISEYLVRRSGRINAGGDSRQGLDVLSQAERRVLRLIGEQKTSRQIAEELHLSKKTVNNHRTSICRKLGLSGAHALIYFAMMHRHLL